jgi:predicted XRE-type DNA-binding protein
MYTPASSRSQLQLQLRPAVPVFNDVGSKKTLSANTTLISEHREVRKPSLLTERNEAEKRVIKESLMTELAEWIEHNQLKQVEAAEILGVAPPRVSDAINKKTIKFTIDALVDLLAKTGKHIKISVR